MFKHIILFSLGLCGLFWLNYSGYNSLASFMNVFVLGYGLWKLTE